MSCRSNLNSVEIREGRSDRGGGGRDQVRKNDPGGKGSIYEVMRNTNCDG